jgi:hypothetical protein
MHLSLSLQLLLERPTHAEDDPRDLDHDHAPSRVDEARGGSPQPDDGLESPSLSRCGPSLEPHPHDLEFMSLSVVDGRRPDRHNR